MSTKPDHAGAWEVAGDLEAGQGAVKVFCQLKNCGRNSEAVSSKRG